mmetsp:Transcript_12272/g.31960  ORF Transcript_12272/g.31960 Transcript_12272/m.31960 type:complete len:135 (-) Transcript_12272:276-680(-)
MPIALLLPRAMAGDTLSPQMPIALLLSAMAGDPLSPQMPIALLLPSAMAGDVLSPIGQLDGGAEPQLPNLGRLRAVAHRIARWQCQWRASPRHARFRRSCRAWPAELRAVAYRGARWRRRWRLGMMSTASPAGY